jgi:hypothetical protein
MGEAAGDPRGTLLARWSEPEIAWPLAISCGALGVAAGEASGLIGGGALAALVLGAPLVHALSARGLALRATAALGGWVLGVAGASAGFALERGAPAMDAVLGARTDLARFEEALRSGAGAASASPLALALGGAAILALALAPRLALLAPLALTAALAGAHAGWAAVQADAAGREPIFALALGLPLELVLALALLIGAWHARGATRAPGAWRRWTPWAAGAAASLALAAPLERLRWHWLAPWVGP